MDLEKRIIVYTFLFLLSVIAFGVLRIYNALVQNTRFTIKLKQEIQKLNTKLSKTERVIDDYSKALKVATHRQFKHVKTTFEDLVKEARAAFTNWNNKQ